VTGGASGIGRACAQLFAKEGASVVVSDVAVEGGQETLRLIEEDRGEGTFVLTTPRRSTLVPQLSTGSRTLSSIRVPYLLDLPQFHHLCVAVYGVQWRSMEFGIFQKPLGFGLWCSMTINCGFRDGSENYGVPGSSLQTTVFRTVHNR
jgi:hypothetical protein